MDINSIIVYSYKTGKFYLINYNSISISLKNKFNGLGGKVFFSEEETIEIIEKAQNPNHIDIKQFNYPAVLGIMATNKCNLECTYCIANNGNSYSKKDNFSEVSKYIIDNLKGSSIVSVMVSGGEPTLYKDLPPFLTELSKNNCLILLDTNGTLINNELLNTIKSTIVIPRISLDSICKEEHNINRGMFDVTLSNIIKLRNNSIDIRINTVLNKSNAKNIDKLADWICGCGIKKWHIFKLQSNFAPERIRLSENETISILSKLQKLYGNNIDILYKFSKKNDGYSSFVIDSEGNCFSTKSYDGNAQKIIWGNITQQSLDKIWQSTPINYRLRHYNKYLSYKDKIL